MRGYPRHRMRCSMLPQVLGSHMPAPSRQIFQVSVSYPPCTHQISFLCKRSKAKVCDQNLFAFALYSVE